MNRRWKGAAAALMTAAALTVPAWGASVEANGQPLTAEQGWIEDGTSYMTLRALAQHSDYELSWDGSRAWLKGQDLELSARPGDLYILSNDRALYVEGGVRVVDGKLTLPLRVVAAATGGSLGWNPKTATASLGLTGASAPQANYNEEDLYWLSRIISAESRGEPLVGQIAVGNVVLNRVADKQFPDTIKDVIFDTKYAVQFEPVANGTVYNEPAQSSVLVAKMTLEGAQVVGKSLYFFAPALSEGTWIVNNRTYYTSIGGHDFYL